MARELYPRSYTWGMQRLVNGFINPMKTVAGKGTIDHSNWSRQSHSLDPTQLKYASVDGLVIPLLYVVMNRTITKRAARISVEKAMEGGEEIRETRSENQRRNIREYHPYERGPDNNRQAEPKRHRK